MKTNSSLTSVKQEAVTESVDSPTQNALLPCPFCGEPEPNLSRNDSNTYAELTCYRCGVHLASYDVTKLIERWNTPPSVPVVGAPVRQGWRGFLCDCGKSWKEATRDYASPSSEICPLCGLNEQPIASWPDATLQVDRMGNLINDVASEDWKAVAGAPVEQTDLGKPDADVKAGDAPRQKALSEISDTPKPSLPLRSVEQERWTEDFVFNTLAHHGRSKIIDLHNSALDRLTQERDEAANELRNIVNIDLAEMRKDWGADSDRQFREWAQNRARYTLDKLSSSNASGVAAKGKEGDATCPETTSLLRGSDAAPVVQSDSVAATPASGAPTETDEDVERRRAFIKDLERLYPELSSSVYHIADLGELHFRKVRAGAPKNQTSGGKKIERKKHEKSKCE